MDSSRLVFESDPTPKLNAHLNPHFHDDSPHTATDAKGPCSILFTADPTLVDPRQGYHHVRAL